MVWLDSPGEIFLMLRKGFCGGLGKEEERAKQNND
jgi:hypothetical protein